MTAPILTVTFKSIRGRREWVARFDLGSARENALAALDVAHKMAAEIVSAE